MYGVTSAVTVKVPYAPAPRACTTRSGMRSRLKWASFSRSSWSCTSTGPPTPAVSLFWLSATGAPASVVSGPCVTYASCVITDQSCPLAKVVFDPTLDFV